MTHKESKCRVDEDDYDYEWNINIYVKRFETFLLNTYMNGLAQFGQGMYLFGAENIHRKGEIVQFFYEDKTYVVDQPELLPANEVEDLIHMYCACRRIRKKLVEEKKRWNDWNLIIVRPQEINLNDYTHIVNQFDKFTTCPQEDLDTKVICGDEQGAIENNHSLPFISSNCNYYFIRSHAAYQLVEKCFPIRQNFHQIVTQTFK